MTRLRREINLGIIGIAVIRHPIPEYMCRRRDIRQPWLQGNLVSVSDV